MLGTIVARLGFDNYLIKKIPEYLGSQDLYSAQKLINFSLKIGAALALLIGTLYLAYTLTNDNNQEVFWLLFTASFLLLPILVIAYLNQSVLMALKYFVISNIPIAIIRPAIMGFVCLLTFFIVKTELSALFVMQANAMAFALTALILTWLVAHYLPPAETPSSPPTSDIQKPRITWLVEASPYTLYAGTSFLNRRIDILLLGMFSTISSVGIYNVVASLISVVSLATIVAQQMGKPLIAEAYSNNDLEKMKTSALNSGALGFLLTLACSTILMILGNQILNLFGNIDQSSDAYPALLILLLGKLLHSLFGLPGVVLLFTKHQRLSSNLEIITVLASAGMGVLLITNYGLVGAALSTSIILVGRAITNHHYARKHFDQDFSIINNIPYFYSLLKTKSLRE